LNRFHRSDRPHLLHQCRLIPLLQLGLLYRLFRLHRLLRLDRHFPSLQLNRLGLPVLFLLSSRLHQSVLLRLLNRLNRLILSDLFDRFLRLYPSVLRSLLIRLNRWDLLVLLGRLLRLRLSDLHFPFLRLTLSDHYSPLHPWIRWGLSDRMLPLNRLYRLGQNFLLLRLLPFSPLALHSPYFLSFLSVLPIQFLLLIPSNRSDLHYRLHPLNRSVLVSLLIPLTLFLRSVLLPLRHLCPLRR